MSSKLVIALPAAAPITEQYEQISVVNLYVMNAQYEEQSSREDMLIDCSGTGAGPFVSLKTGQSSPTLPTGATRVLLRGYF
jgi:hypothetical protein